MCLSYLLTLSYLCANILSIIPKIILFPSSSLHPSIKKPKLQFSFFIFPINVIFKWLFNTSIYICNIHMIIPKTRLLKLQNLWKLTYTLTVLLCWCIYAILHIKLRVSFYNDAIWIWNVCENRWFFFRKKSL